MKNKDGEKSKWLKIAGTVLLVILLALLIFAVVGFFSKVY